MTLWWQQEMDCQGVTQLPTSYPILERRNIVLILRLMCQPHGHPPGFRNGEERRLLYEHCVHMQNRRQLHSKEKPVYICKIYLIIFVVFYARTLFEE